MINLVFFGVLTTAVVSHAWMAVGPVADGKVNMFALNDDGTKGKDVMQIPVGEGETLAPNSFTCGRCFCLLLTQNEATSSSTLYNLTFCGKGFPPEIPPAGLNQVVHIPKLTTNLHSNYGEGDGGAGYTIEIDKAAHTYWVIKLDYNYDTKKVTTKRVVDVSAHVNGAGGGTISDGASAFCSKTGIMWLGLKGGAGNSTGRVENDSVLTIDIDAGTVSTVAKLKLPIGAGLFGNCKTGRAGSVNLQTGGDGRTSVVMGEYGPTGAFEAVDSITLPAGSKLQLTPIVDTVVGLQFSSEFGAVLMSPGFTLPGALFTSKADNGGGKSAVLSNLQVEVLSIAVAY